MDFHVFTTNRKGGADDSPLQFISDEKLAYFRGAEAVAVAACTLMAGAGLAGVIIACAGQALVIG